MNESKKRLRAPNYSGDEKIRLLNIIASYKNVVENKQTDTVTWKEKDECWKKITTEFNASSGAKRSVESIKGFFENQKRRCHKRAAVEKRNLCGTGGGPVTVMTSDPTYDLTLSIVNKKSVFGFETSFGGDAVENNHSVENRNDSSSDNSEFNNQSNCDSYILEIPGENDTEFNSNILQDGHISSDATEIYDDRTAPQAKQLQKPLPLKLSNTNNNEVMDHEYREESKSNKWQNYKPSQLKTPVHKKLTNPNNSKSTKVKNSAQNKTAIYTTSSSRMPSHENWTARRKPSATATMNVARKYEDLCEAKKQIVELELKLMERYEEHQVKLFKAQQAQLKENEIQNARNKELFELDRAIKKQQLKNLMNFGEQ